MLKSSIFCQWDPLQTDIYLFYLSLMWAESCPLQIHIEVLTPNVTVFGDRALKEVIKVK